MGATAPVVDPQTTITETKIDDPKMEELLERREALKAAVSENRKISKDFANMIAERFEGTTEAQIRVGRFTFTVVNDPGGTEVQGYTTEGGVKARRIQADE